MMSTMRYRTRSRDILGLAVVLILLALARHAAFGQGFCHSARCGSNVPRNANTDAGPADCTGTAERMRAHYAALMQEYSKLERDSAAAKTDSARQDAIDQMGEVRDEIATLRRKW